MTCPKCDRASLWMYAARFVFVLIVLGLVIGWILKG